jgi:hypothetical protein
MERYVVYREEVLFVNVTDDQTQLKAPWITRLITK